MNDQREAGDKTIGAHEVARAKFNLGETGRLLVRMDDQIATLTAVANLLVQPGVEISLTAEQFESAKNKPPRFEIEETNGRVLIRAKE